MTTERQSLYFKFAQKGNREYTEYDAHIQKLLPKFPLIPTLTFWYRY